MTFNTSNLTTPAERNLNILLSRYQTTRSNYSKQKAIAYARQNWKEIGEDFKKACYWVFGRGTFVETAQKTVSENLERVERLILIRQENSGVYDV